METSVHPTENSRATQTRHPSSGVFLRKGTCFRHFSGRGVSGGPRWTRSPLHRKMAAACRDDFSPGQPEGACGDRRMTAAGQKPTGQVADWAWAPMAIQNDQSPRSLRPRSVSFSRTSLRLVTPKFLHSMRSSAVRRTSSPMELMPSLVVHFRARTERLSSVIGWE